MEKRDKKDNRLRKWALFVLRWGVAVVGIWYVLSNITLYDTVYILNRDVPDLLDMPTADQAMAPGQSGKPLVAARLAEPVRKDLFKQDKFWVYDPRNGQRRQVDADLVFTEGDVGKVQVVRGSSAPGTPEGKYKLLAVQLRRDVDEKGDFKPKTAQRFLVLNPQTEQREVVYWYEPHQPPPYTRLRGVNDYKLHVPRLPYQVGLVTMLRQARPIYLALALIIFPITFIVTSYRWHELLKALDIRITTARAFVLNMVGAFYNTFMPGSTGGDVLKAYYISKHTPHRTRAVMSVFVDRVIGLLALVILGGAIAAVQWLRIGTTDDAVGRICSKIALASGAIVGGMAAGLVIFYNGFLRKIAGLNWLIKHMPMQEHVQHIVTVMEIYRGRPWLVMWSLIATFPVHLTVAASAMLVGQALKLPISPLYYFVCVPVIVLAGSIPISPQGAGVMEVFAIKLTEKQGASVSEAFALAMCIRLTQILWNLTGGILVLRGGYHAPTASERQEVQTAEDAPDTEASPTPAPGREAQ